MLELKLCVYLSVCFAVCLCVFMCLSVSVCMYACLCVCIHACESVCVCLSVCVSEFLCLSVCLPVSGCMWGVYLSRCLCVCVCVSVYEHYTQVRQAQLTAEKKNPLTVQTGQEERERARGQSTGSKSTQAVRVWETKSRIWVWGMATSHTEMLPSFIEVTHSHMGEHQPNHQRQNQLIK